MTTLVVVIVWVGAVVTCVEEGQRLRLAVFTDRLVAVAARQTTRTYSPACITIARDVVALILTAASVALVFEQFGAGPVGQAASAG